jgi:Lrp/AsnC family transcriptional regulator, leucine-responsive regulatory protein
MGDKLDAKDLHILGVLQRDARTPIEEVARQIGLTKTPTASRIRKLEERGIIERYAARLNPEKLGLLVTAFVSVTLTDHTITSREAFATTVLTLPHVLECHFVTGDADLLLKVRVTSIADFQHEVIETISRSGRVATIATRIVMSTLKEDGPLPLPALT